MEQYLVHYGVKGMKWGVRKKRESSGTRSGAVVKKAPKTGSTKSGATYDGISEKDYKAAKKKYEAMFKKYNKAYDSGDWKTVSKMDDDPAYAKAESIMLRYEKGKKAAKQTTAELKDFNTKSKELFNKYKDKNAPDYNLYIPRKAKVSTADYKAASKLREQGKMTVAKAVDDNNLRERAAKYASEKYKTGSYSDASRKDKYFSETVNAQDNITRLDDIIRTYESAHPLRRALLGRKLR